MSSLSFTKLFSSITDSSIWQESSDSRVVWVTLLAMADPLGRVHASISGLARRSNVSREATEQALAVFLSPDPDSRTSDHEGRRIEAIEGGWRLLNYKVYREKQDEEAIREANRVRQERYRKNNADVTDSNAMSRSVTHSNALSQDVTESNDKKKEKLEVEVSTSTNTTTLASTAIAVPAARGKLLGTLPLTGGRTYEVREDDLARDGPLYPAVDVIQEYRNMKGWLMAAPQRQKTPQGIRKFMNSWLSREQDKARPQGAGHGTFKGKTEHSISAGDEAIAIIRAAEQARADRATPEVFRDSETGEAGHGGLSGIRLGSGELLTPGY